MRRTGQGEGKVRCAHIARQLSKISQKLDPDSWSNVNGNGKMANGINGTHPKGHDRNKKSHNTRELIEKFLETLEKDLLRSFDDFYRRQNFDGMRECANVLHDFNDGGSVIGSFVNQHQFFIDRSQLITEEVGGDAETWEKLADPDADPPGVEPSLQSLVDEVRIVVQEESLIIRRAFPYAEQVLGKFIQRVFQQSIQMRLEMVLEKASSVSSLAFLRSLQAARSCISTLIDDLKSHGLTEYPEPVSPQTTITLDQQFDDLFVPYLIGSSYIEREKRSLDELFSSLLFKFTIYHSRRRKVPTTFMKSLTQSTTHLLTSARDAYVERLDSSDLRPAQKRMLLRVAGLKNATDDSTATPSAESIDVSDRDGVLSVDNAKRMLKWLAEAVGRGLELSAPTDTAKDVSALLNLLLTHMGEIYIETALDSANDLAVQQESSTKTEPDLSYLIPLRSAIATMHLLSTAAHTVLIPLASTASSSNLSTRRDMEKSATVALDRMEDKVNTVMHRSIDIALSWTSKLLLQQKKTDFRPRDEMLTDPADKPSDPSAGGPGAWLEQLQTPTCASIFGFLTRFHQLVLVALSPGSANLRALLTETAIGLRSLLLDHFKKFQVNAAGGIMVTKDLSKYIELLKGWETEEGFAGGGGRLGY